MQHRLGAGVFGPGNNNVAPQSCSWHETACKLKEQLLQHRARRRYRRGQVYQASPRSRVCAMVSPRRRLITYCMIEGLHNLLTATCTPDATTFHSSLTGVSWRMHHFMRDCRRLRIAQKQQMACQTLATMARCALQQFREVCTAICRLLPVRRSAFEQWLA